MLPKHFGWTVVQSVPRGTQTNGNSFVFTCMYVIIECPLYIGQPKINLIAFLAISYQYNLIFVAENHLCPHFS